VFLETSLCNDINAIREAVKMLGPTKVIHGSDSPEPSFLLELKKIEVPLSDKKDRELVLGSNMTRILGIR